MGQKVNPHGLRLGINKEWDSVWYAEKDFAKYLLEDHNIRQFIKKYFRDKKPRKSYASHRKPGYHYRKKRRSDKNFNRRGSKVG